MDNFFDWLSVPLIARRTDNYEKKVLTALKSARLSEIDDRELSRTLTEGGTMAGAVLFTAMPYDMQRSVIQFIREMFSDWGIDDLQLAFSFCAVGLLDDYLPARQGGGAYAQCYGRFDTAYLGKIMNAYTKFARAVYNKVSAYAPRTYGEQFATDKARSQAHTKSVVMESKRAFDTDGRLRISNFDAFFVWVTLKNAGLIAGRPATANDLGKAMTKDDNIEKAITQCFACASYDCIEKAIDDLHKKM